MKTPSKASARRKKTTKKNMPGLLASGAARAIALGLGVIVLGYVAWRAFNYYGELAPEEGGAVLLGLVLALAGVIVAAMIIVSLLRLFLRLSNRDGLIDHLNDNENGSS